MSDWVEWMEPAGENQQFCIVSRMLVSELVKWRRELEPRYETDEQALDDFLVVYWAQIKQYAD